MVITLIFLIAFIFLSACFSGFESAIIAINQTKLNVKIEQKNKKALIIKDFLNKPEQMLSLILLGNSTCTVLTTLFAIKFSEILWSKQVNYTLVAICTTLILLTFAEILPKLWFRQKTLERSFHLAYLMLFFDKITFPITKKLASIIHILQKKKLTTLKEIKKISQQKKEDFIYLLNQSLKNNNISYDIAKLLKDSLNFYNLKAKNLMTPFEKVISISMDTPISEIIKLSYKKEISRFPVYKKDITTQWVGILSIYDALFYFESTDWKILKVHNLMRKLPFIDSELTSEKILLEIQQKSQPLFAVKNKKKIVGIISSTDIIRPLLGEIA